MLFPASYLHCSQYRESCHNAELRSNERPPYVLQPGGMTMPATAAKAMSKLSQVLLSGLAFLAEMTLADFHQLWTHPVAQRTHSSQTATAGDEDLGNAEALWLLLMRKGPRPMSRKTPCRAWPRADVVVPSLQSTRESSSAVYSLTKRFAGPAWRVVLAHLTQRITFPSGRA